MKSYLAQIKITLKLTLRDRLILFFGYVFPLIFFFIFAQVLDVDSVAAITQVVTMVLILGVLGTGFFGAGIRAVQERELNILRRFKVAPITPAPILVASLVTGWVHYLPSALMFLAIAHFFYGMPVPERLPSLIVLLSLGVIAFRSIGLIIASVVNSVQESQIIIQSLYLPMLFLSGATVPVSMLPPWLQVVGQFLPATYLYRSLRSTLLRNEGLGANGTAAAALVATTVLSILISMKLFRWEKGEKVPATGKLWLLAVFAPFLLVGLWTLYG